MNIRRGLARIAHDQAEHLTTRAILLQKGLERRRITRLVIFGIEFASFLPVIGFDFSLSLFHSTTPTRLAGMTVGILPFFIRFIHSPGISVKVPVVIRAKCRMLKVPAWGNSAPPLVPACHWRKRG
jgi:hypothetical protein